MLWKPSPKERKSAPALSEDASLEVVLHEVELSSSDTLYLVSSLEMDGPTSSELYCRRYDVEFDIRPESSDVELFANATTKRVFTGLATHLQNDSKAN